MQLYYKQYSQEGEPLIILHGLFGNQGNWSVHARYFAQRYCVYAFDARNHGRSSWCETMSYPEMAEDIIQTMDALDLQQVSFIAHSMGGKTAMQLALLYPERVKSLVVVDMAPVAYPAGPYAVLDGLEAIDLVSLNSRKEADQLLSEFVAESVVRDFLLTNLRRDEHRHYCWRFNLAALVENYSVLKDGLQVRGENRSRFEKEVLFIKGEKSDYILPKYKDQVLAIFPHAKVKVIENAGHWVHSEKPDAFIKIVEGFLDDIE